MNGSWLSFPINDHNLNQDLAIRRFCPARVEQEQAHQGGGDYYSPQDHDEINDVMVYDHDHDMLLWSPTTHHNFNYDTTDHYVNPQLILPTSDEVQFVDGFFNTDYGDQQEHPSFMFDDHRQNTFHEDFDNFCMSIDDIYKDAIPTALMLEGNNLEMSSSYDEDHTRATNCSEVVTGANLEDQDATEVLDQGLRLVHMLLACAEAVGCRDIRLADSLLTQLWSSVSPWGDSLQRVSYCFAMGLRSRLTLLCNNVNANGTFTNGATDVSLITKEEKMEAFHLLHQTTPYIAFGFMAANDAILQAAQGKDFPSLHIIDLGMEHTLQWMQFVRTLSLTNNAIKLVRITGIINDEYAMEIESSMKVVISEARSLGITLEFSTIDGPATSSILTKENLKLVEGEGLFVNSIMHLHKYVKESRGSLKIILQAIKKLGPSLLTVVEQDGNHNGPFFLGRFLESLHYYSAVFDSLEASLPRNSSERMQIEKLHFAEEIRNIVAYEGSDRYERHERSDQWRRQLARGGFQMVGLKCWSEVKNMLMTSSVNNNYGCTDGYTVASEKGCLLLGWKGRPIMFASAWQANN